MYVCMYACMHVYTYVRTYIHTYIHTIPYNPFGTTLSGPDHCKPCMYVWEFGSLSSNKAYITHADENAEE